MRDFGVVVLAMLFLFDYYISVFGAVCFIYSLTMMWVGREGNWGLNFSFLFECNLVDFLL